MILNIEEYIVYGFLITVIVLELVMIFYRVKSVGIIFSKINIAKERYIFLGCGLMMLTLWLSNLYVGIFLKYDLSEVSIIFGPLISGIAFVLMFLTSKIFIGERGISFQKIPFYISYQEVTEFKIENNILIIKRQGKKDYKISFDKNDTERLKAVLNL
jgi:hypothetical protein